MISYLFTCQKPTQARLTYAHLDGVRILRQLQANILRTKACLTCAPPIPITQVKGAGHLLQFEVNFLWKLKLKFRTLSFLISS